MAEHSEQYPVISKRQNGDRLIGIIGPFAEELYNAGTPPVHGFAAKHPRSPRVANVRIGDRLRVTRAGDRWVVSDEHGQLGVLRWGPKDTYRNRLGEVLRRPETGTLYVQRVVIDPSGTVKDIGGYVESA